MSTPRLRILVPVALATGLAVRRRRARPIGVPSDAPALRRRAEEQQRPARPRHGARPLALGVLLVALIAPLTPASSEGPCEASLDGMRLITASLGDDGDVTRLASSIVGLDGTRCSVAIDPGVDVLGVQVGLLHRDTAGAAIDPARLPGWELPVTTRVRVTDTTRSPTALTFDGPEGPASAMREIGVPRSVRITVSYPSGWHLTSVPSDGAAVHHTTGGVEVTHSALLFPPFTSDEIVISAQARPGRGTPTITVEATPTASRTLSTLLDRTDDRAALAVIGALLDLSAEGADDLAQGALELADGLDELADATVELADGVDELVDGVTELLDGIVELVDGVRELRDGTREFADGLQSAADGTPALVAGLDELIDGAGGLSELAMALAGSAVAANLPAVEDDDPVDALIPVAGSPAPFTALLSGLSDGIAGTTTGLAGLRTGLVALAEGLDALAEGGDDLADAVDALLDGVIELRDGVADLLDGVVELADGTRELADGTREVADGARTLAEGAEEFPGALRDVLAISDRRAAALALDEVAVDTGILLASDLRDGAALVSVRLEHAGLPAFPAIVPAATGGVLAAAGGMGWFARRRRRA